MAFINFRKKEIDIGTSLLPAGFMYEGGKILVSRMNPYEKSISV
jgi:hypothetical protein